MELGSQPFSWKILDVKLLQQIHTKVALGTIHGTAS